MFRFSIRDVLSLTVIVALCVGWYIDHREVLAKNAHEMRRKDETLSLISLVVHFRHSGDDPVAEVRWIIEDDTYVPPVVDFQGYQRLQPYRPGSALNRP